MENVSSNDQNSKAETSGISRREALTSLGILAGASALGGIGFISPAKADNAPNASTNFSLTGKSAIVTGAARGIGRAIAVALATAGADNMAIDIAGPISSEIVYPSATKEDLEETRKQIEALNRRCITVVADTRDTDALKSAADRAEKEFGKIKLTIYY